jgi:protein-disulfide isomerase
VSFEFPLGEASFPATVASTCAEEQGRYWEMHDMLFAKVESWASESKPNKVFVDIAGDLGMDKGDFKDCIEKRENAGRILASKKFGTELGVTGTPTIFVNGQAVPRTRQFYTYEGLEAFIQEQVAAAAAGAAE